MERKEYANSLKWMQKKVIMNKMRTKAKTLKPERKSVKMNKTKVRKNNL